MECAYHPGVAAAAYCTACGKPICASCRQGGRDVCPVCAARAETAVPSPPPPPGAAPAAVPPAPPAVSAYSPPPVAAAPRRSRTGLYVGLACGGCLLLLLLLGGGGLLAYRYFQVPSVVQERVEESTAAGPAPSTTAASDAVTQARGVMEQFIEYDRVHNGQMMQHLLAGQALSDFRPDIQGQGDAETVSEMISKVEPVDDDNVKFQVKTVLRDLATGAENNVYDWCRVQRTGDLWKIVEIQYGE